MKKIYLCNRRKCESCSYPTCQHTTQKEYAARQVDDDRRIFERLGDVLVECVERNSVSGEVPEPRKKR